MERTHTIFSLLFFPCFLPCLVTIALYKIGIIEVPFLVQMCVSHIRFYFCKTLGPTVFLNKVAFIISFSKCNYLVYVLDSFSQKALQGCSTCALVCGCWELSQLACSFAHYVARKSSIRISHSKKVQQ